MNSVSGRRMLSPSVAREDGSAGSLALNFNDPHEPAMRTLKPLHREIVPPRQCKERGCKTWLCSHNKDDKCAQHGGFTERETRQTYAEERSELYAELEELMA